ncbi:hypothetical protein [Pseudomonas sp. PAMC 26793]|uniref:hypothetical protein n=1 Tax=Pseudomonas sp. PAMC 26793 TaxID=1240676 RepID=UPI0005184C58|nr:hypothetical protein [Pseudomonas sp. PAMC 26793]
MSHTPLPYFFPEALRVDWRALERERQLNIDSRDIEFLGKVFFASDAGRRQQSPPMIAQRIWLNKSAANAVELAGSFMMSPPAPTRTPGSTPRTAAWKNSTAPPT